MDALQAALDAAHADNEAALETDVEALLASHEGWSHKSVTWGDGGAPGPIPRPGARIPRFYASMQVSSSPGRNLHLPGAQCASPVASCLLLSAC